MPRPICRSIFVSSLIATPLLSMAVDDYITQTRCMRTLGDVIGRKASQKTPQMMILSPVIRQLKKNVTEVVTGVKNVVKDVTDFKNSKISKIQKFPGRLSL